MTKYLVDGIDGAPPDHWLLTVWDDQLRQWHFRSVGRRPIPGEVEAMWALSRQSFTLERPVRFDDRAGCGAAKAADGWLVVANTPMANVPVMLFGCQEAARTFASRLTFRKVRAWAYHVLRVDVSDVVCVAIVPFRRGVPGTMEVVMENVPDGPQQQQPKV